MKPEQKAWQAAFREMGGLWLIQRIEDRHSPDIPDAHFCYKGECGWIEMKASRHNEPMHLRPGQLNWLHKWGQYQHCFLLCRVLDDQGRHQKWLGVLGSDSRVLGGTCSTPDKITEAALGISGKNLASTLDTLLEISNKRPRPLSG